MARITQRVVAFPVPDPKSLLRSLAGRLTLVEDGEERFSHSYLDTFDWRLHRAGLRLTHATADGHSVLEIQGRDNAGRVQLKKRTPPAVAADFASVPFADAILDAAGIRRLLPVANVAGAARRIRVLGAERKTVVRLRLVDADVGAGEDSGTVLEVRSVRGYDESMEDMLALLEHELDLRRFDDDEMERALIAAGRRAGDYSSKYRLDLDPEERSDDALRRILAALLETVQRNGDGTRRSLDPEFLHDFRVAVRRARSALSQMPGVLDADEAERLAAALRWLGDATGRLRDLDVHLLAMPGFRRLLPDEDAERLEVLARHLTSEQKLERRKLAGKLRSAAYREVLQTWESVAHSGVPSTAKRAAKPIGSLGRQRVRKALRRVLERGREITVESESAALHSLRIEAKKLRYAMEFFRSLVGRRDSDDPIRVLKKLQDILGAFNDLAVQQQSLTVFSETMMAEGTADARTLLAIGRLIERLAEEQEEQRDRFAKRFRSFAAEAVATRQLFSDPKGT